MISKVTLNHNGLRYFVVNFWNSHSIIHLGFPVQLGVNNNCTTITKWTHFFISTLTFCNHDFFLFSFKLIVFPSENAPIKSVNINMSVKYQQLCTGVESGWIFEWFSLPFRQSVIRRRRKNWWTFNMKKRDYLFHLTSTIQQLTDNNDKQISKGFIDHHW